jgi:hypothetical protein
MKRIAQVKHQVSGAGGYKLKTGKLAGFSGIIPQIGTDIRPQMRGWLKKLNLHAK